MYKLNPFKPYSEASNTTPKLSPYLVGNKRVALQSEGYVDVLRLYMKLTSTSYKPFWRARQDALAFQKQLEVAVYAARDVSSDPMRVSVVQLNPGFANKIKYLSGESLLNYANNLAPLTLRGCETMQEFAAFLYYSGISMEEPQVVPKWLKPCPTTPDPFNLGDCLASTEALMEWNRFNNVTQPLVLVNYFPDGKLRVKTHDFAFGVSANLTYKGLGMRARKLCDNFNLPSLSMKVPMPWTCIDPVAYLEAAVDPFYRGVVYPGAPDAVLAQQAGLHGYIPDSVWYAPLQVHRHVTARALPMELWSLLLDYYPASPLLDKFLNEPSYQTFLHLFVVNQLLKKGGRLPETGDSISLPMTPGVGGEFDELAHKPWGYEHLVWLYGNLIRFV